MTDTAPNTPALLPRGTVLDGRYRVERVLATEGSTRSYEARDLQLSERRVALLIVPVELGDDARRMWTAIDPPHAPLIAMFPVDRGVVGVFSLPDSASMLHGATGLSREQRASLWVEAYSGWVGAPERPLARWVLPGAIWWMPGPAGVRAWLLPLPLVVTDDAVPSRADVRAMAHELLSQLYGVADPSDEAAMKRLPDAFREAVEDWLDDDATLPSPEQVAAALQVSATSARVPVPTATTAVSVGAQSRVASARRRIRALARREAAVFLALMLAAAIGFLGLLTSPADVYRGDSAIGREVLGESPPLAGGYALPPATPGTLSPEPLLWSRAEGQVCRSLLERGPVPTPTSCLHPGLDPFVGGEDSGIGRALGIALHQPFVVVYRNELDQLVRVERFESAQRFAGYDLFRYGPDGALLERLRHRSTALLASRVTFDPASEVFEDREISGASTIPSCASIRFTLTRDGDYASWRCMDAFGAEIPFAEGHDTVVFERTGDAETEVYLLDEGPDLTRPDGVRTSWVRRDVAGRITETMVFDGMHRLVASAEYGVPIVRTAFTVDGYVRTLHDADERLVEGPDGWAREQVTFSRETGAIAQIEWHSRDGEPRRSERAGVARIAFEPDARGQIRRETYDDGYGGPAVDPTGVAAREYVRDAHGNVLQECHYDLVGRASSGELGGAHCVQASHDASGQLVSERFFGVRFEPTANATVGVHEVRYTYDESGRRIEQWYFDAEGEPAVAGDGSRGMRIAYDRFGAAQSYQYLWAPNQPTTTRAGLALATIERDATGREVARCFSDTSGRAARLVGVVGAGASCIVKTYDARGQLASLTYANAMREPVTVELDRKAGFSAAVVVNTYATGVGLVQQHYYGPSGSDEVAPARDCRQPLSCLDASGWEWYSP